MIDNSRARAPSLRVTIALALLAILWLAMLTVGTGAADEDILRALYVGGQPALVFVARGFTFLGSAWVAIPVALAAVVLLAWLGRRREAVIGFVVIALGRLLVEGQKYAIARLRPEDEVHLVPVSTPSFPSGHSANSMILCLTLAILFFSRSRWRHLALAAALLLAVCIGVSRVMLGVHWPTDVIGGWAFGLLWVLVAVPLAERVVR